MNLVQLTFKLDRVALHRPEYAEENGLKNEKSIKEEKGSKSAMKKPLVGWVI